MPRRPHASLPFAAALFPSLALSAAGAQPPADLEVAGRVTAVASGRPVERAEVVALGVPLGDGPNAGTRPALARALTDASGRFRLVGLPPGPRTVVARAIGLLPDTAEVTLRVGQPERLEFALRRPAAALTEIVVTSQKRTEALQDVPVAVTAYDGEFLRAADVREFDQLSQYTPGLNVQLQSPNNPGFVIRGITSDDGSSQVEPRVSVFQDGVSISKSRGSVVELFDLERVEVLKGPQGTLFGRGAQTGAVHLIQNKPAAARSGELRVGTGNYSELYASGVANAPLAGDWLLGRVAGIYNRREGFIDNLAGGTLNGKETLALRGALRVLPGARTVVDVITNWQQDTPPGISFRARYPAPGRAETSPFAPAFLDGGDALGVDRTVWGTSAIASHSFSPALALTSTTAYRRFDSDEAFDADGTALPALRFNEVAKGGQWSQELRLNYDAGGRFAGFGGVSGFREEGSQRVPLVTNERALFVLLYNAPAIRPAIAAAARQQGIAQLPNIPLFLPDGTPNVSVTANPLTRQPLAERNSEGYENFGRTAAAEAFVDGTVRVAGGLELTAGLRGTYEDVRNGYITYDAERPAGAGALIGNPRNNLFVTTQGRRREGTGVFRSAVGRAIASYDAGDGLNLFAGVARGRRPAVVNVGATTTATLPNEIVWSYEGGLKASAFADRLGFDVNGYYFDYSNFQTTILEFRQGQPLTVPSNAGEARAYGAEGTARVQLTGALGAFATYGYLEARIADENADGARQALAGKRFRLAPKHQASAGATLQLGTGALGRFTLTPTVAYRSHVFFEAQNQAGIEQEGYTLVHLRAALASRGGRWELAAVARNLLDEEYIIDAGNTGATFGVPTFIAGAPRLLSVQLGRTF